MRDVYINGLGAFLPNKPVPNKDIESYIGKINGQKSRNKAIVLRQNKIKTRHYALDDKGAPQYSSAQMAAHAVTNALKNSEVSLQNIRYLAASSTLGDVLVPGHASNIHGALKIPPLEIANFQSVCASSIMALKSAWLQLGSGEHECAAVTGSEFASRYFRPGFYEPYLKASGQKSLPFEADFLRFTLSDGAGAALLEAKPNERQLSLKIKWIDIRSYADRFDTCMSAGETDNMYWGNFGNPIEAVQNGALFLKQNFKVLNKMIAIWVFHYLDLIDQGKIVTDNIDHLCSHYSSHSLREEAVTLLDKAGALIDENKWFSNLYSKGNTGTASIFIMLEELFYSGTLKSGQNILCHVPESGRCVNGLMMLEVI
ncbi:MAG: beta-ketoacyl-ACP synthase III [Alphaproteobacteria bacterium]|nr:beta-ketoacyl-ACP synthase III [Alphaproteobacteria bacterium]